MNVLDLSTIDQGQFDVKSQNGKILIVPRKDKHRWKEEEKWFRSVVCDENGRVLSVGFPKFLNFHEDIPLHTEALTNSNRVDIMPKMDGSLIVLSYNFTEPEVLIRTRGSTELGEFHDPVMSVVTQKYPFLLDPDFYRIWCGHSFLFEFTSPDNQIVVQYEEPELTFLGVVQHGAGWPPTLATGGTIHEAFDSLLHAQGNQIRTLHGDIKVLGEQKIEEVISEVSARENDEGVVLCCDGTLFKIKSHWYLMLHALRYQLTPKKLRKLLVLERDTIKSFEDFRKYLFNIGYDFEVTEVVKEEVEAFFTTLESVQKELLKVEALIGKQRAKLVQAVKQDIDDGDFPDYAFSYAMSVLDRKDSVQYYPYCLATEESVHTVRMWLENKEVELESLVKSPEDFEDEEEN